ncbi:bifunctional proline dehydrogenase/L-glutamate gamma-semialdehyde dehydrogenase, partial [Candidatus Dependentiae bacterium]|nr:bifunctional proline dehydrogenase/L-glutamate gamma-semialdehyde dehydrogenase [Candidatus Dependentiae bacterium]
MITTPSDLRLVLDKVYRQEEEKSVQELIKAAALSDGIVKNIQSRASGFVEAVRAKRLKQGGVDAFLKEYDLSGEEGIALMCLAEAVLRIPDKATQDKLIADKIAHANWLDHAGESDSLFV